MYESLRIAIASTDGKVINEHFGRAKEFYIVNVFDVGRYEYMEKRSVAPLCSGGEHSDNALDELIEILSDCNMILAARIGAPMKTALESRGVTVLESPAVIEDALPLLAKEFLQQTE